MGKHLKPEPAIEKSPETGANRNWVLMDNIFCKDMVTAFKLLYDHRKAEAEKDPRKIKEFKITEENRSAALEEHAILNPSTTRNYAPGKPPDKDHLKM